jgi:hypothetical protein
MSSSTGLAVDLSYMQKKDPENLVRHSLERLYYEE